MEDTYYIISNSDGDTTVTEMTKPQLLEAIEENYWGDKLCLGDIPGNRDTNYWGDSILIIKGKIVTPDPVDVVRKYDID
jgi:hypothetical protein